MIRRTLKLFALSCVAVFALGSMAEAAPKKVLHRRAKHSARVSSSGSVVTSRKAIHRKHTVRKSRRVVHRHPTTKPR
jgi:hypothetical protein